jgi:chromate reductase
MSASYRVAVLAGSLRKESINRKIAEALTKLASSNLTFDFLEIGQLPLYNQDLDETSPRPIPSVGRI